MNPSPTATAVRRLLTVAAGLAALAATAVALAGPASAEPAEGWPPTEPVDSSDFLIVLLALPAVMFVVIVVLTYLPALIRGERIAPGAPSIDDQWLGGRRSAGELTAPDGEAASAGGASGRW